MEELLAKYFSGEADEKERTEVESWRKASKEQAEFFFEAKKIWIETSDDGQDRQDILASILYNDTTHQKSLQQYLVQNHWIKYAAAVLLLMTFGLLFLLNNSEDQVRMVRLADASEVFLHQDTEIEVLSLNEELREVALKSGKAYF
ncbi:MAG: hypothetical protein AAF616_15480, partial [Bacteroidota bacterium]